MTEDERLNVDLIGVFGEPVSHQRPQDAAVRTINAVWTQTELTEFRNAGAIATVEALRSAWPTTPQPGEQYTHAGAVYEQVGPPRPAMPNTWLIELKYLRTLPA